MRSHKGEGERGRTGRAPRTPAAPTDLAAFREHFGALLGFTEALRDGRCRRTTHFEANLQETIGAFRPLFAPWNMEVVFLLYVAGPLRFNALKRKLEGVSSRVLTDKLRHLEAEGLLHRDASEEGAVTYRLSIRGGVVARHLHPLLFYLHNRELLPDVEA